ncbi:hypothetical protein GM921_16230 [Pedobacter sp. LMG 31464]|uniref:Lipocalin-like domain-containing protein n=1 Tax=Pedobacter planticolens TaxID=2679964 RepID=A0A923E279_9SPHI|nr:hypothetical protein [Pedobacter planticolens]MBB2147053.1 hypothetical protein [Pedobacter planticolens]
MKNLNVILTLLAGLAFTIYGCKKETINAKNLVQQQLIGKWPLKYTIKTIYTNNVAGSPDTVKYNPIDTLVFSADGKLVRQNTTVISTGTYSIDGTGDNITFSGTPAITQKLSFVRNTSIGLATETTVTSGSITTKTVVEDQLIK